MRSDDVIGLLWTWYSRLAIPQIPIIESQKSMSRDVEPIVCIFVVLERKTDIDRPGFVVVVINAGINPATGVDPVQRHGVIPGVAEIVGTACG